MYGGYWRYLTVWNFLLQLLVNILLAVGEHIQAARTLGDLLHHGISFGCTVVVFVIYWGLYFTKTELIRPNLVAQENFGYIGIFGFYRFFEKFILIYWTFTKYSTVVS